jgi:DNA helicase-4
MNIGNKVRHKSRSDCGIGEVIEILPHGKCSVVFPNGSFSGIPQDTLVSIEVELLAAARQQSKSAVLEMLVGFQYNQANKLYTELCSDWWPANEYHAALAVAKNEQEKQVAEDQARRNTNAREEVFKQVSLLLDEGSEGEADNLYQNKCTDWWSAATYEAEKACTRFVRRFVEIYQNGTLSDLDVAYNTRPDYATEINAEDFVKLKLPKLRRHLATLGVQLDEEQECANARPEYRLLIKARAGSGKTRTLCARAVSAIRDENLDPNQVMILAFNKAAAAEVKHRVRMMGAIPDFENARTFHSLAYQLVKQKKKKLLFDDDGHPSTREQSRFVQRMLQRILNPAFKDAMVEFFRKELEQIESIGRDLSPLEYLQFRRALELITLRGERVKSNGEKFIADFLFEHGFEYRYERVWEWKTGFLDGIAYKPDFSIVANGHDYILEHWAIDLENPQAALPPHWDITAAQYKQQIRAKRDFWNQKGKPLIETHTGLMRDGRTAFENQLKSILGSEGIQCQKLSKDEVVRRVFENDFAISRIAELFLQFIQRAKKRGWSVDEVAKRISDEPDREPRSRLFHQLALRAYREYEKMLEEQQAMDFDDLLAQAAVEVEMRGASASIHLGQGRMVSLDHLKWILLDEFQDFSELYFRMLGAIVKANPEIRLVAVGDDWQAINAFAGAELRFFEQFSDYFPGSKTVGVTTNYRSDRVVVAAGNRLMRGKGSPAKMSRNTLGQIQTKYLEDIWFEFRQGDRFEQDRKSDAIYLQPRPDGRNPSEAGLRQARSLKLCTQIILDDPYQKTLLLARTGIVYGMNSTDFRGRLIAVLSSLLDLKPESLEKNIAVMTAHGSKGQEAYRVIILDVTRKQFPKIHPDNFLFELFGVTPQSVLEEERRLFYVAMTRAQHALYLVTEKGDESPYLDVINNQSLIPPDTEKSLARTQAQSELGTLAAKIRSRIK